MTPLFLKEKEKQEIRQNVQISTLSFLKDKTNITKTRNATRCNNHDDLLHLGFVLKISLFSGASLKPSRTSMIEFSAKIISC